MRKIIRMIRRILTPGKKVSSRVLRGSISSIEESPMPDNYKRADAEYPEIYRDPYPPYFK